MRGRGGGRGEGTRGGRGEGTRGGRGEHRPVVECEDCQQKAPHPTVPQVQNCTVPQPRSPPRSLSLSLSLSHST